MLKRSPKSKLATVFIWVMASIALYIGVDSLLTFRSLVNSHGQRKSYLLTKSQLSTGSPIPNSHLATKELFSNDAPSGAIESTALNQQYFAKESIPAGTFLTKSMISKTAIDTIDSDNRIMFVPTKDKLDSSIGSIADLMYVSPDGYGSETIAYDAKILYEIDKKTDDDSVGDPNSGYFVEISSQEAQDLTTALASGDVRFALRQKK